MRKQKGKYKTSWFWIAIVMAVSICSFSVNAKDFYVSPMGKDKGKGTLKNPFATIAYAQLKVREYKEANPSEAITVYLRGGKYYLSEPIVFTSDDSGTKEAPITYKMYKNEVPQVLGGVKLDGLQWEKYKDHIYKTKVPKGFVFETLFVNGIQQVLARYPNYREVAPAFHGIAADCLSKERVATWEDPTYGYFHAMHKALWGGVHYQITGKKNKNEVNLEGGTQNNRGSSKHARYRMVENIFEELDTLNEWYLNRNTSELFFYPENDIDLNKAEVEVAALEQLFVFDGTKEHPVKHISIEGLTLKRTIRTFMKTADRLLRSDWTIYRGGVVHFEGTENCTLKDCELSDLGGNAVFFNHYNKNSRVEGCHIFNVGGSGVCFVGDINTVWHKNYDIGNAPDLDELNFTRGPKTNNYPQHCLVDNNLIHNIGTIEKQTAGVQISLAAYITVSRNSIYDVPRAGINISEGKWGGHILEYNDVFLTVQETHDHGAFNSWGRDRYYTKNRGAAGDRVAIHGYDLVWLDMIEKNIIRNNRFRCDHGWDIDLDDGSACYEIYNNVCLSGGIKLRDGMLRKVYNNVCINNSMNLHVWLKNSGDTISNNICTHGYFPIGMRHWGSLLDSNLFFQKESLKKIQNAYHTDPHSVYGDPMFADAKHGDFTVKNTGLADKIGWVNFPMDQFGVQKPSLKAIALTPEIPDIELTADEVVPGIEYMGGVIKNIVNDGEKSAAGLPDYKGAKIVKGLTKGIFSLVKLQDDDVVLKMDDEEITNIDDFMSRIAGNKVYKTLSVWRFQKMIVLELPDPADCNIPMLLNKADWRLISMDSEAPGYEAKNAIDGNAQSFWHTQFEPTEPPFPHEIVVDMGKESLLHSFEYLPRQGSSHPRIKDFKLYVSKDGKNWGEPQLKGIFKNAEAVQSFPMDNVYARYFKLVGLSGYTRNAAAVGEISFYGTCVPKQNRTYNLEEDVLFKRVNGKKLKMDIYYPDETIIKNENPWILFVHGGGWAGGNRDDILKKAFLGTLENLLDSGIVVATIDYRLARSPVTSYESMLDCKDAARFLVKNAARYMLDTVEYGVWGGSAGGHLGLLTALAPDSSFIGDASLSAYTTNFKCALSFFPFTSCLNPDLRPGSIFENETLFVRLLGGTLEEKPDLARLLSPDEHVKENSPATLLVHGTKDPTLPILNSEYLVKVAQNKKADFRLLAVKNAKHSFRGSNISPSLMAIADSCTLFVINHLNRK